MSKNEDILLDKLTEARRLLMSANKWLRRLDERRNSIKHFFDSGTDPRPLRMHISKFLKDK